jgi:predicted phosphodiesterase
MRFAVIADIHSDLPSLEKGFKQIRNAGIEQVICLGDIVGYSYHYSNFLDGRDPDACIQMVMENCVHVVCGNHDLHAIRKLPENHEDIGIPGNWYDLDLEEQRRISDNRLWLYDDELEVPLKDSSKEYLASLAEMIIIEDPRFNILATHFIWPDITGHMKGSPENLKAFRDHISMIKRNSCLLGLAGHAHLEGYAQISKKAFGMNYFRQAEIIRRRPQIIIIPAITRSDGRNGYLVIDTEKYIFEAIAFD